METRKMILPTMVAVVTLIALVAGATYAYFSVVTTGNFGTRNVSANAATVGTVAIVQGNDLSLTVTATDMMNPTGAGNVTYYATTDGTNNVTSQSTAPVLATLSTTSDDTFTCTYTLGITATTSTMVTALRTMTAPEPTTGQLFLKLFDSTNTTGTTWDLYTANTPAETFTGTITGITKNTPKTINGQLYLVNVKGEDAYDATKSQNKLAGTSQVFQITATSVNCTVTN